MAYADYAQPPCNRILTVRISERSLYDIESVMYQMVHELAHYVGCKLRCRATRQKTIIPTLLRWIIDECGMESETCQILWQIIDNDERTDVAVEKKEDGHQHLEYLLATGENLLRVLQNADMMRSRFETYYQKYLAENKNFEDRLLTECGIEEEYQKSYAENFTEQYASVKHREFHKKLMKMNGFDKAVKYRKYIELMQNVYRECYADMQMILVLGMGAEDYLDTFLVDLKIKVESLLSRPDSMLRISAIVRIMTDCGLWKIPLKQDNTDFGTVFGFIDSYNKSVIEYTESERINLARQKAASLAGAASQFDFKDGICLKKRLTEKMSIKDKKPDIVPLVDMAEGLYEYLLEVMGASLEEYSSPEKMQKIQQARKLLKRVLEFKDAVEVFNCVEEELNIYKREGCQI